MTDERYRWRTNPAVVAQFYTGEELPKDVDVHLRPNEACAIIENGSIVDVGTATRLTLNPSLGTLSRLLSRREPFRSFMFAHTGPHELLVPLKGSWKDGSQAVGMAGIKMHFSPDNLGRLILLPSKGQKALTLGHLAELIGIELNQKFSTGHLSSTTQEMARTDSATGTLLEAGLRNTAQTALADIGAVVDRVWISWTPSDHDRITLMRQELETMAEEGKIVAERDRLEMERMLAQEVNVLERQHQLLLATTEYEAKAEAAKELAALRVKAEREREQWAVITKRAEFEAENMRRRTELDKQQEALEAKLDHEIRMDGLDRTMEFEDKEEELKFKREMRQMKRARRQSEFMQELDEKAAKHNNKMLKGAFDAMDDDDTGEPHAPKRLVAGGRHARAGGLAHAGGRIHDATDRTGRLDHLKRRNSVLERQRPSFGSG